VLGATMPLDAVAVEAASMPLPGLASGVVVRWED
jgi:hypothetical protein